MNVNLLNARRWRMSLALLSAAALLSLSGCKDDKVKDEEGCTSKADCMDGEICNSAKVCVPDPTTDPVCGNGAVEASEQCDDGVANSNTKPDACRTNCKFASCGDSVVDEGEECDGGEAGNDGVACNADCTLPDGVDPVCGDGVVQGTEECDEGADGNDGVTCNADCTLPAGVDPVCGDGVVEGDEACDDGVNDGTDCNADCTLPDDVVPVCGDEVVQGTEQCDDGDANSDTEPDACRTDCTLAVCGDGVVDTDEACDEGADNNDGTTCNADCTEPVPVVTTALRWNALSIIEPMFYMEGEVDGEPTCDESDGLINMVLGSLVGDPDEDDGNKYGLNIVHTLDTPLAEAGEAVTTQMNFPATCVADESGPDTCTLTGSDSITWTLTEPVQSGDCFERVPAVANADGWLDNPEMTLAPTAIPSQGANSCLMGSTDSAFTISIMGYDIPLNGAYMSMELDESGTAPSIARGLLGGFVTEAAADDLNFLDIVIFSALLNGGTNACIDTVALDVGPDGEGGTTSGWWLYVAFAGDAVLTD